MKNKTDGTSLKDEIYLGGITKKECVVCGTSHVLEALECPCGNNDKWEEYYCVDVRKVEKTFQKILEEIEDLTIQCPVHHKKEFYEGVNFYSKKSKENLKNIIKKHGGFS